MRNLTKPSFGAPVQWALCLAVAALLAACASSTPYSPAADTGRYGFSEQKIEADRFRLTFSGNSLTSRETVETYLLYRAAEITIKNGFDHFIVVSDDTEKETSYSGTANRRYYPYFYGVGRPFPYYGYGYRWGPGFNDVDIRERNRYSAIAYIVLGKGEKPADTPAAYTAREVLQNLGPLVERPEG